MRSFIPFSLWPCPPSPSGPYKKDPSGLTSLPPFTEERPSRSHTSLLLLELLVLLLILLALGLSSGGHSFSLKTDQLRNSIIPLRMAQIFAKRNKKSCRGSEWSVIMGLAEHHKPEGNLPHDSH